MYTFSQRILDAAPRVRNMFANESAMRGLIVSTDLRTLAVLLFCLMWNGIDTATEMERYLAERGCRFDHKAIDFLLNAFDGDDPERHLWTRHNHGDYCPMLEAMIPETD